MDIVQALTSGPKIIKYEYISDYVEPGNGAGGRLIMTSPTSRMAAD